METEAERQDVRKAMAYDLKMIVEDDVREIFSKKEVNNIIDSYILAVTQK